jgi:hypothetical protein
LSTTDIISAWAKGVGGFDADLASYEDWDFWIRLARAGRCFVRVAEPLVLYRTETGTRRRAGREIHADLLATLRQKYKQGERPMPCNCGASVASVTAEETEAAGQFVLVRYSPSADTQGVVIGAYQFARKPEDVRVRAINDGRGTRYMIDYGMRHAGDVFYVHILDYTAAPNVFQRVAEVAELSEPLGELPPAPDVLDVTDF